MVLFVIAACAAALVMGGCGAAATTAATTSGTAASGTPTAGGAVHLVDYSQSDGPTSTVIITGGIGDFGKAVSIHPDGTVDPDHTSQLNLELAKGSFRLSIAGLDERIVAAFRQFPYSVSTCSGTVTVTGTTPIVAGSGTGAYRGIGGSFDVTATIAEVDARSASDVSGAYLAQVIFITGSGSVSFG